MLPSSFLGGRKSIERKAWFGKIIASPPAAHISPAPTAPPALVFLQAPRNTARMKVDGQEPDTCAICQQNIDKSAAGEILWENEHW
jgi:hypothetical protein